MDNWGKSCRRDSGWQPRKTDKVPAVPQRVGELFKTASGDDGDTAATPFSKES